jgi:hypothetical protein
MKRILTTILVIGLISACKNEPKEDPKSDPKEKTSNSTVESMAKSHIESKLSIPADEKYTYHIYKEHLDSDNKIDAVITVNRKQFALHKASKSNKTAKSAETGFMGNYNYIFYYDGGLNMISPEIQVPSSALCELKIIFENITSDAYKDIIIDYRIMDASFYDFLTVNNHSPERIFQWKHFEGLDNNGPVEAFHFEYTDGTLNPRKDILVKKSILKKPTTEIDRFTFVPELVPTDELAYRFFYLPQQGKYVTQTK